MVYPIIHIAGSSGSGKTTMGRRLKQYFGQKIYWLDLDEITEKVYNTAEFVSAKGGLVEDARIWKRLFAQYLQEFIDKHRNKPIVLVGYNSAEFTEKGRRRNAWVEVPATHKFYLNVPHEVIMRQGIKRAIEFVHKHHEDTINQLLKTHSSLTLFDYKTQKSIIDHDNAQYKFAKYRFMKPERLFQECVKVLKA